MNKIKLLHLISRIDIGGAEKQLLNLVVNLDKEKYNIYVGYFQGKGELKKKFRDCRIQTNKFGFIGLWDISILWQLYKDMRANRYDIVHTHGFKADLWGTIAARLAKVPVIISTVHNQERYLINPIVKILEKWIISPIDDTIIVVSEGVKRFLIKTCGIQEKKIKRVYYGINLGDIKIDKYKDIRQKFGIDRNAPLIGCIGRLIKQKGHQYLIQAAKMVMENFPEAKFLIVGKGRLEKKLKKLVKSLSLESSVIFTGFREDIYSIIDKLNLMVMPSIWEGFGLVLLEAMALGKPVVATNIGGIPEIIEDGKSGILVKPKDSKGLARAIIKLLQDTTLNKKMQGIAQLSVKERFPLDKMLRDIDKIYSALIEQKIINKIKVLHIIESTGKSGPRSLLCSLVHNLNKDRFTIDVICSALRDKDFYKDIQKMKEAGIRVIILQMRRNIALLSDLIAFFKLCFYLKKGRYDIVHTHSSKAGFLGRIAGRLTGVRVVIHTPHCFCFMAEEMSKIEKLFYFYIEKIAGLFCDRIIAVSESQRQDILKRGLANLSKVITIENGVDIYKFSNNGFDILKKKQELGLNNGSIILGTVGVLNESKGHCYLIEAVSKIIKEGFDVRLIIVGEGELRKDLETLSYNLGLNSRIKLLGFREDIAEILSLMDIFVFPSLWEGMSLALLEAMASGLPVISTDVHGAVDLIGGNKRGILVQRKDVLGLVKALRYLISNRNVAKQIGKEAQRLICKNYDLKKQIDRIENLYMSMLFSLNFAK